jgi:hypothetical protein
MLAFDRGAVLRTVRTVRSRLFGDGLYENVNKTRHGRRALLLYLVAPFRSGEEVFVHQNLLQILEIVKALGEFQFDVDVMNFSDRRVRLQRKYDLVVDIHPGLNPVYAGALSPSAIRIAYLTGSNPTFTNRAEEGRLEALYRRRGIRLKRRRYAKPFRKEEIESFDAVLLIANDRNSRTYDEFSLKNVHLVPNIGYGFLRSDDFSRKSTRDFLFLASLGQVHKGLDLLLEVFSGNPGIRLHVCSSFRHERDFCRAYERELFGSRNIFPVGFLDITGSRFREITGICSYVVMPSCAEGIAGSVLTAMSSGLVPIVSPECGFEDGEVQLLKSCSLPDIEETLLAYSRRPIGWIEREGREVMRIVGEKYGESRFAESIRAAFRSILGGRVAG